jgi:hypothetical protein
VEADIFHRYAETGMGGLTAEYLTSITGKKRFV